LYATTSILEAKALIDFFKHFILELRLFTEFGYIFSFIAGLDIWIYFQFHCWLRHLDIFSVSLLAATFGYIFSFIAGCDIWIYFQFHCWLRHLDIFSVSLLAAAFGYIFSFIAGCGIWIYFQFHCWLRPHKTSFCKTFLRFSNKTICHFFDHKALSRKYWVISQIAKRRFQHKHDRTCETSRLARRNANMRLSSYTSQRLRSVTPKTTLHRKYRKN